MDAATDGTHDIPSDLCPGKTIFVERVERVEIGALAATIIAWECRGGNLLQVHMPRATWNGVVVAESSRTEVVESNHYFPPDAIHAEYSRPSQTHMTCGWKGQASYYDIAVGDAVNHDAAWYYPAPLPTAAKISGCVAFWKGVTIEA